MENVVDARPLDVAGGSAARVDAQMRGLLHSILQIEGECAIIIGLKNGPESVRV